ncbi:hypothetical protein [Paractinoplanes rishiriensis]|uniref:DUF1877 family protein n=1 Tax=Paractinoplanes rishiriensis TaxID=1050105 RepID=A0A919K7L7_9ACTN|nr:hypothetical protein [Actinoplanes rishiriensis]GIE99993.1 hypothetical protein Ari01nite_74580 [Actinoplanes rishiriensis]
MSTIIKFFVAPDDEVAAGVAKGGPGDDLNPAVYGNFDVWTALGEWDTILTGAGADNTDVVSDDGDPLVLAASPTLTAALAGADAATVARTGERWRTLRADEGEDFDEELVHDLLTEIAGLAAAARRTDGDLYCWVC